MQNVNKQVAKATVATKQAVVTTATGVAVNKVVANNAMVRLMQRVAAVQALRAAKNAARKQAANQQAYMLQVAQLAAQYNMPVPAVHPVVTAQGFKQPRANSATVSPSSAAVVVGGVAYKPTKAVHAFCALYPEYTRKQLLQICIDNGINAATASTQYGVYQAALKAAAKAAAAQ